MTRNPDLPLTAEEHSLLSKLSFNAQSFDTWAHTQPAMTELTELLLKRDAIAEVRWKYFVDSECNPGGRGKSRADIFEKNGTYGDEILRHPHFLPYLEYFLCGPDLPAGIVAKFKEAAAFGDLSGSDVLDLAPAARAAVRAERLNPHDASDEFFKLALECGAAPWSADTLRKNIRAVRI